MIRGLLLLLVMMPMLVSAEIVHRERSLYSNILVDERGSILCLRFSVREELRNQSCKDLDRPQRVVFDYVKMMMKSLLLKPNPERILIVGLGGGTLPVMLNELYPEAVIDVVEIDPAVKKVAEDFFEFRENARIKVYVQDARVFTKRALLRGDTYDIIMLDAFTGDYIPEHLMTREYLEETKALLTEGGAVVANTHSTSGLYDHESVTYQSVFGEFFNVRTPTSNNRVIIATGETLPSMNALKTVADELSAPLRVYDIRVRNYRRQFSTKIDWDEDARLLTDQYAPANLLNR